MKKMPTFIVGETVDPSGEFIAAVNVQQIAVIRMSTTDTVSQITTANGETVSLRIGADDMLMELEMNDLVRLVHVDPFNYEAASAAPGQPEAASDPEEPAPALAPKIVDPALATA